MLFLPSLLSNDCSLFVKQFPSNDQNFQTRKMQRDEDDNKRKNAIPPLVKLKPGLVKNYGKLPVRPIAGSEIAGTESVKSCRKQRRALLEVEPKPLVIATEPKHYECLQVFITGCDCIGTPGIDCICPGTHDGSTGEENKTPVNPADEENTDPENTAKYIKGLKKFRQEHFFETSYTGRLIKYIPPHTCVHNFIVDERGFLVPEIKTASYDSSRCTICNKLLIPTAPQPKLKKFNKHYSRGLMTKSILLGNEATLKVVKTNALHPKKLYKLTPQELNSYALKYQK